jgi:hypothetical protein
MYNMDEKGMMIGKVKKHHRIFTKQSLESGRVLGVNEPGSREWITMLATICADGTWGRPMLIYASQASELQDTWLSGVDPSQMDVSFSATASGWTNDSIGLQWLTDFEGWSRDKLDDPKRDYRLLILDGHGSHVTSKFFEICYQKRIILAVFPPHSTHRLQPLDIGMFRPFAMRYSMYLDQWHNDRLGHCNFSKREFFQVFWPSYLQSFTTKNVLSAWEKSGIWPRDSDKIVRVVKPSQGSRPSTSHSTTSIVSIHAYIRVRKKVRFAMAGISDEMASMVSDLFAEYQFALAIAEHERDCYKRAVTTEKARRQRSKPYANTEFVEEHGKRLVWNPHWMEVKAEFEAAQAAKKTADDLAKEEDKARKQQEKEQQVILTLQRKSLRAETALQKKIAKESEAAEKARAREEARIQKEAKEQLQSDMRMSRKLKNTKKQTIQKELQPQSTVQVTGEDNDDDPPPPAVSSRGRTIHPKKHFGAS